MSGNNGSILPTITRIKNPYHDLLFQTVPPDKHIAYQACCSNCMKQGSTAAPLQKCSKCKASWYCSRNCQKENWDKHKKSCHDVKGKGISRLVRKFATNKLLMGLLQVCLICRFNLLRNAAPDKPFMARIDVGIEPSDITVCYQLFAGAEIESKVEGMLQLNALTTCDLVAQPLTPNRMELWRRIREETNAAGYSSEAVGLVEFVNDSEHSITLPVQIQAGSVLLAQRADPFEWVNPLGGSRKAPLSDMSCLEFINTHIRSDYKNVCQLRVSMSEADKEIIRGAGRGEDRQAVLIFKEKIAREGAYRVFVPAA